MNIGIICEGPTDYIILREMLVRKNSRSILFFSKEDCKITREGTAAAAYSSPPLHRLYKHQFRGKLLREYSLYQSQIEERAVAVAGYIIENNATVRQAARQFGVSKSTVHKDVTERLLHINPSLAAQARKILDVNKSERHIRGGMATKEKYLHQHVRI